MIPLRVTPKSGKNAVPGAKNGLLLVAVRAAPADDQANAALGCAVLTSLSHLLGCAKSSLVLVRGEKSREKTVRVAGWMSAAVRQNPAVASACADECRLVTPVIVNEG